MRHARGARARRLVQAGVAVVLAQAALHAPAHANGGPQFSGCVARTFSILGTVHKGGTAFSLNALVPVDGESGMFSLGLGAWMDDMGQGVERLVNPETDADIGTVAGAARFVAGGGLAADFHPGLGSARGARGTRPGPFLAAAAGIHYVESREQSSLEHTDNALGWNVAAGWRFRVGAFGSAGPSFHYYRVFDDRLGRFMAAGLDWTWR